MKVRDAMTGDVLTMTPGRSLRDAAKSMADHNVGAVVIEDPEQPGPGHQRHAGAGGPDLRGDGCGGQDGAHDVSFGHWV